MKLEYLLFATLLIIAISVSGCVQTQPAKEFIPVVDLQLDNSIININNNTSSGYITATITRKDNVNVDTNFTLRFPQGFNSVYPVDSNGYKILQITTKTLKGENSKDTLQFSIYGNKGDAINSNFEIKVELWWNNMKIEGQDKTIKINIQ